MRLPRSIPGWTVAGFGATAAVLGAVGLIFPDALLGVLGFESAPPGGRPASDHTRTFLAASSMASLNMGVYYLVAAVTEWRPFFVFSVAFRMLTCGVFTLLVLVDVAPARFLGVALWEGGGALITAAAIWHERRKSVPVSLTPADAGR